MFGKIGKNKEECLFLSAPYSQLSVSGEGGGEWPRTEGCKPWSWGQREVCCEPPPEVAMQAELSTCVCPLHFLGGPGVKAGGVCDGDSWEQEVRWGQGRAGETPRPITTSHWLNIRCALEVINGTFLLLLENAVLLKLERFLSRCCFLSSYEWKKTTKPKQKNPSKTKQNKQSPNPKGSLSCKHLWRDPAGFSSCGPSEPSPAALTGSHRDVPLFVNKFNELLSRYILSSVWAEGTRIWA